MAGHTFMATLFRGSNFVAAASIVVCWLVLGSGCNLFEPRDPEAPSQSSDSFIPPSDPDIVIENLQNAIAQKIRSTTSAALPIRHAQRARSSSFLLPMPARDTPACSLSGPWTRRRHTSRILSRVRRKGERVLQPAPFPESGNRNRRLGSSHV